MGNAKKNPSKIHHQESTTSAAFTTGAAAVVVVGTRQCRVREERDARIEEAPYTI